MPALDSVSASYRQDFPDTEARPHSFARKFMIDADWRSSSAYDSLDDLNWPSRAWEFLRRDEEYHADYADPGFRAALDSGVAGAERRWGLRFRGKPCARRE
ncbi:transcriptional regulator domain-containing protein [Methylocystis parvus]|uniref:transcriptional regulator domain-containing protein n=1 Tax=Methylocystis parvus TaxID=134 RepID=UPI003B845C79